MKAIGAFSFLVLLSAIGCTASGGGQKDTYFELLTDEVIVYRNDDLGYLLFSTDNAWTLTKSADWYDVDAVSGEGSEDRDQIVTLTFKPNNSGRLRYDIIRIAAGDKTAEVPVVQSQYSENEAPEKPEMPKDNHLTVLTPQDIVFTDGKADSAVVSFKTEGRWTIDCDKKWVNVHTVSGEGSDAVRTVTVSVPTNSCNKAGRKATLTITSGMNEARVSIEQKGYADADVAAFLNRVYSENYCTQYFCAHRANTYAGLNVKHIPENTALAVDECVDAGLEMVEIDGRLTKDSVVVCIHDADIGYVTNGKGAVGSMTYEELCRYDMVMRNNGVVSSGLHINTLEQVLLACKDRIYVNLDFSKDKSACFIEKASEVIKKTGTQDYVLIYVGGDLSAANRYSQCLGQKVAYDFYALDGKSLASIATGVLCQFGGWDNTYQSRYVTIRGNGFCSIANMLDHDNVVKARKGISYLDKFTGCRIDMMQTDVADCDAIQNYYKQKGLR